LKRMLALTALMLGMTGCSIENAPIDRALSFRSDLLSGEGCSYGAEVTADYGDELYVFSMDCRGTAGGDVTFTVTGPEVISGISGTVSNDGGTLTFEDTTLHFGLLTDDQLSPVSGPWIFLRTLRSGCISSACVEEQLLHITADDSYADDALTLDIWLDGENRPVGADVLYDGKRILSMKIENFTLL